MRTDIDRELIADIEAIVSRALAEDIGSGDLTADLIPPDRLSRAEVISRHPTVLCGASWFEETFRQLDDRTTVQWQLVEGELTSSGQCVCTIEGTARGLLSGERTALNFLQTLSGTAAAAREYAAAVSHTKTRILDTRKTLPGLRLAQKYAVRIGGGSNHRAGLFDAVLIKENHIAAKGSIAAAVAAAAERVPHGTMIEVEVESLTELEEALQTAAVRIMLDNFDLDTMRRAVERRNATAAHIELEASGGVTFANVGAVAETGVDLISVGAITKDVSAADYSMRFL